MATYEERKGALERKHLTASALIKEVLCNQATEIFRILAATGYYFGGHIHGAKVIGESMDGDKVTYTIAATGKKWSGQPFVHGRLKFSNIRKGGAPFLERELPYETDREAKEALSMTISNRADDSVERHVKRQVAVGTTELKTKEDKIKWDINVGFEFSAGKRGTELTGGSESIGTFKTSFGLGGEHTFGKQDGSSESITKELEDTFTVPGKTKVKVVGTFDKITLRQDYRIYYPIDYDVEMSGKDFGVSNYDTIWKWYSDKNGNSKFEGIDDILSAFLGHPALNNTVLNLENIHKLLDENQGLLNNLEAISDKDKRMIVQRGTITYNDASDISVDTWKLGTYDERGELIV